MDTFYNIRRLHLVFAIAAFAMLAVTLWMLAVDHRRTWKEHQRSFSGQVEGREGRRPAVKQIRLPDLTIDYHLRRVARVDRCVTCHQGIDRSDLPSDLPHPYRGHPRLDLFVGAGSPHPMAEFGCTVCHEGQGSATEFRFAAHTPNHSLDRTRWEQQYGWVRDPYWEYPMLPARFSQSRCLACHHSVSDLESSRRFPDPPAEKLLEGYHLVRNYGCFGCHEIRGLDATGRVIGPDLRLDARTARTTNASDPPGTMPRTGPSLRRLAGKVDRAYLVDRLADPARFLPSTRMPRLYGLDEHLGPESRAVAERFEPIEIHAIAEYLLGASEPFSPPVLPRAAQQPSAERGKRLLEIRGCLACHTHGDFPKATGTQGPELTRLGAKYAGQAGRQWLVAWLRDPSGHTPKTLMPGGMLDADAAVEPGSDPAADVAEYLLSAPAGPAETLPSATAGSFSDADLDELAGLYRVGWAKGDTRQQRLRQLGRAAILRRGCFGCHDIPGVDNAQPIGPALSDWGRKAVSHLGFEWIDEFRAQSATAGTAARTTAPAGMALGNAFYPEALAGRTREGFLWQKLRQPRSYDFKLVEQKRYTEWLTMGRFVLSDAQREAIAAFVLGLVADPPGDKYVCHPAGVDKAIVAGRQVLDKYACAECHTMRMEQWTFTPEGGKPVEIVGMPRLTDTGAWVEDEDDDGQPLYFFSLWEPAGIAGRPWLVGGADVSVPKSRLRRRRAAWGGALTRQLYPTALAAARSAGFAAAESEAWGRLPPPLVAEGDKVQAAWLRQYLVRPQPIRPAAAMRMPRYNLSPAEAARLADYFAAAALEAQGVPAGAARVKAGVAAPEVGELAADDAPPPRWPDRWDDAMRILTDRKTFCAKCHGIGSSGPGGEPGTVAAPQLDEVYRRLRPGFIHRWLANPSSLLPFTVMPINFPASGDPIGQDLFPGSSQEQLGAVADLLVHYDEYLKRRLLQAWPAKETDPQQAAPATGQSVGAGTKER